MSERAGMASDPTVAEELNELLASAGLPQLDARLAGQFQQYLELLMRWNARLNLTAIRDREGILSRHFVESIACARAVPEGVATLLDFGSGAGFPGIPIALCRPEIAVTLAESQAKKAAFLHYIIGLLGLSDAQVIMRKVEDWNDIKPEYDLLTTRALKQEVIFEAAPRVLSPAGRILLYRAKPLELVPATCKIVKELSFTLPFDGSSRTLTLLQLITP